MSEQILEKLDELQDFDAQKQSVERDKQAAIDGVLTDEIKEKLREIDAEFDPIAQGLDAIIASVEDDVKQLTLSLGETVKGAYIAVYNRPRVSWNTKELDGYAAAHPEIEQFRKIGKPSVSIRRK